MKRLIGSLVLVIMASSCTYVYYPTYPVIPDSQGKGFGMGGVVGFSKAQLSAWYAIDSNIYVTGTFNGALSILGPVTNTGTTNTQDRPYNSLVSLLGVGYKVKATEGFEAQIQAGMGLGKGFYHTTVFNKPDSNDFFQFNSVDVDTRSIRTYLQPSFGFINKKTNFYIIPRFTYESFRKVTNKSDPIIDPFDPTFDQNIEVRPKSFLITEGFMLLRFKTEVINIDLYAGVATNLLRGVFTDGGNGSFVSQPIHVGFGLNRAFN